MYDVVIMPEEILLAEIDDGYWIARRLRDGKMVYPISAFIIQRPDDSIDFPNGHDLNIYATGKIYPSWIKEVIERFGNLPQIAIDSLVERAKEMNDVA